MAVNTGINRDISGYGENSFMTPKSAETVRNCDISTNTRKVQCNIEIVISTDSKFVVLKGVKQKPSRQIIYNHNKV